MGRFRSVLCALIAGGLTVGVSCLLPSPLGQAILTAAVGSGAAGTGLLGIRRHRLSAPGAWYFVCAGVAVNSCGTAVGYVWFQVLGSRGAASPADACYLLLYPCMAVGMVLMLRRGGQEQRLDRAGALDAACLSVGLVLLCWVLLIHPADRMAHGSILDNLITLAYPIGDLALMLMLGRLLLSLKKAQDIVFLGLGLSLFLLSDAAWSAIGQLGIQPSRPAASALTGISLLAYASCGLAAFTAEPEPGRRQAPNPEQAEAGALLLAMLTLVMLLAPGLLLIEAVLGRLHDAVAMAVCSAVLALLVVARLAHVVHLLQRQSLLLRQLALQDPLTGAANRRAIDLRLPELMAQAHRRDEALSVIVIDLDHFKQYNDTHGHPAGDRLLSAATRAWSEVLRKSDVLGRIGGEEFVVLLPGSSSPETAAIATRLLAATPFRQTFSAGIATWDHSDETGEALLERADQAMYAAKEAGRNRCITAVPHRPPTPSLPRQAAHLPTPLPQEPAR